MINQELAKIFYEMAAYLKMENDYFRSLAYEKAAQTIESLNEDIKELYQKGGLESLEKLSGIGQSLALHVEEYLKDGKIKNYEELKNKTPVKLGELIAIGGVGPKMIKKLYQALNIKTVADLEKAAKAKKIRKLTGFGEKSETKILKGIKFLKNNSRFTLGEILPVARNIESKLRSLKEVKRVEVCGSLRRKKETIGDLDILVISDEPKTVMDFFTSLPPVEHVYAKGKTKSRVRLKNNIEVDLRVVSPESFGAGLQYFTGSKAHNIALREIASKLNYKLNEYGLFMVKGKKEKLIAGKTEEEIYETLGLKYVPPELRENTGEIEAALQQAQGKPDGLPKLIEYNDLKGDLQVQTDWSDGNNSIEEMTKAAMTVGLKYIVITDHTKYLKVANGLDEKQLLKQIEYIDKLNSGVRVQGLGFRILTGAEVNILPDGSLDINDEVLEKLDFVGAAVHSHFNLSRKEQTERIKKAMANKNIDIIFHPTGRIINSRPPYEIDIEEIIKYAAKTRTILEINAFPSRLDLKDDYIRLAVNEKVLMAIDSDAHNIYHFNYLEYGVAQARRGWAEKKDIINAMPLKKFLEFIKKPKKERK